MGRGVEDFLGFAVFDEAFPVVGEFEAPGLEARFVGAGVEGIGMGPGEPSAILTD